MADRSFSGPPVRDTEGVGLDWVQYSVILVQETSQANVYSLYFCALSC